MKRLWISCLLLSSGVLAAQTTDLNSQASTGAWIDRTQIPSSARYEVFRTFGLSSLAFKLDKYEGVVHELVLNRGFVKTKDDTYAWQRTRRLPHPKDTHGAPGQVNYQLVACRVGPLLVNVQTGVTWLFARDPTKDEAYWYPITSQSVIGSTAAE
jgi:hypothetical protein